jgi:hypothetical protein
MMLKDTEDIANRFEVDWFDSPVQLAVGSIQLLRGVIQDSIGNAVYKHSLL